MPSTAPTCILHNTIWRPTAAKGRNKNGIRIMNGKNLIDVRAYPDVIGATKIARRGKGGA
jgi:hypothetical protein